MYLKRYLDLLYTRIWFFTCCYPNLVFKLGLLFMFSLTKDFNFESIFKMFSGNNFQEMDTHSSSSGGSGGSSPPNGGGGGSTEFIVASNTDSSEDLATRQGLFRLAYKMSAGLEHNNPCTAAQAGLNSKEIKAVTNIILDANPVGRFTRTGTGESWRNSLINGSPSDCSISDELIILIHNTAYKLW